MRARTRLAIGAVGVLAAVGLLTGCGDAGLLRHRGARAERVAGPGAPRSPATSSSS